MFFLVDFDFYIVLLLPVQYIFLVVAVNTFQALHREIRNAWFMIHKHISFLKLPLWKHVLSLECSIPILVD